jgi:hypothetical protein
MRTDLAVVFTNPSGELRGDGVSSTAFILNSLAQAVQRATAVSLHLITVGLSNHGVVQTWATVYKVPIYRMPEMANPAKAGGALGFVESGDMDCVGSVAKLWVYGSRLTASAMIARLPKAFFLFQRMPETANPAKAGDALGFMETGDMDCVGSVAKHWVYGRQHPSVCYDRQSTEGILSFLQSEEALNH